MQLDDLRPELGCYGASHIRSPHIDQLAQDGVQFDRAYCQVAVCNPSRSSLLTGCRPDSTQVYDNQHFFRATLPDIATLPQHFKNHGYTTLSLGKIFHHSEREPGDDPSSWSEPAWYHGEPYRHWFTRESLDFVKKLKALPKDQQPKNIRAAPFEAADEPDASYPDAQTATKAIETLQQLAKQGEPFFLGVGMVKPHLPFTCPQSYWDLYPADNIALPGKSVGESTIPAAALHSWYELRSYGTVPAEGDISDAMAKNLVRGYRACVSFMDHQVGRVLAELDRLDLRKNTIVVFWGDHGYHLGENNLYTKMSNFELGTRVPLIVSLPEPQSKNLRTSGLVELVDLYPTLAELCRLPLPEHLEGTSFVPLLEDPKQSWKQAAFSQYLRPGKDPIMGRSLRTDRWRYTEWHTASGINVGYELYDHSTDPQERRNVASEPSNEKVVVELATQLNAGWQQSLPMQH